MKSLQGCGIARPDPLAMTPWPQGCGIARPDPLATRPDPLAKCVVLQDLTPWLHTPWP